MNEGERELHDDSKKKGDPLFPLKVIACAGLAGFGFMAGVDTYFNVCHLAKAMLHFLGR